MDQDEKRSNPSLQCEISSKGGKKYGHNVRVIYGSIYLSIVIISFKLKANLYTTSHRITKNAVFVQKLHKSDDLNRSFSCLWDLFNKNYA